MCRLTTHTKPCSRSCPGALVAEIKFQTLQLHGALQSEQCLVFTPFTRRVTRCLMQCTVACCSPRGRLPELHISVIVMHRQTLHQIGFAGAFWRFSALLTAACKHPADEASTHCLAELKQQFNANKACTLRPIMVTVHTPKQHTTCHSWLVQQTCKPYI